MDNKESAKKYIDNEAEIVRLGKDVERASNQLESLKAQQQRLAAEFMKTVGSNHPERYITVVSNSSGDKQILHVTAKSVKVITPE